jgi:hypothetical protein
MKKRRKIILIILCLTFLLLLFGAVYYFFFSKSDYKTYKNIDYVDCYLKVKAGERKIICNITTNYKKGYKIEVDNDNFTAYLNNKKILSDDISSLEYYEMSLNNDVLATYPVEDYYVVLGKSKILVVDNEGNVMDMKKNVYPTIYFKLYKQSNSDLMNVLNTDKEGMYIFTYVNNEKNKDRLYMYYSCYFNVLLDAYRYDESTGKIILVKENLNGSSVGCST